MHPTRDIPPNNSRFYLVALKTDIFAFEHCTHLEEVGIFKWVDIFRIIKV